MHVSLMSSGLLNNYNPPTQKRKGRNTSISYANALAGAFFLKKIPYADMYQRTRSERSYNFMMLDGALVQMDYEFDRKQLIRHRLAFLPAPDLLQYQNEPEMYDEDDIFGDIVDPRQVAVPLRFDYDIRPHVTESVRHPAESVRHPTSHLTLGQYQHCRIPVTSGVTPRSFMGFVLASFYTGISSRDASVSSHAESVSSRAADIQKSEFHFPMSITESECTMIHVATPTHNSKVGSESPIP